MQRAICRRRYSRVSRVCCKKKIAWSTSCLKFRFGSVLGALSERVLTTFTSYDANYARTPSPLAVAKLLAPDIPVAIIASRGDWICSADGALRIYNALVEARGAASCDNVHLLMLDDKGLQRLLHQQRQTSLPSFYR
jgi:hypothetical protein